MPSGPRRWPCSPNPDPDPNPDPNPNRWPRFPNPNPDPNPDPNPSQVFRHEAYGRPVDVYSFAMIMYNMLGVEPPWPELSGPEAVKRSAMQMDRPPLPRHWDATLAQLIRSCWLADPAGRPSFSAVRPWH